MTESHLRSLESIVPSPEGPEIEVAAAGPTADEAGPSETRKSERASIAQRWVPVRWLYDALYWLLYVTLGGMNRLLARPRPVEGRPISVLRVVSSVAEGGVAKVALQTTLAMSPEHVRTIFVVFGSRRRLPEVLRDRPTIGFIRRKMELFPAEREWRLFRDLWKLARLIARERPDLVHVHEPQFVAPVQMAAGLAGGCPVLPHLHSVYQGRREGSGGLQNHVERCALRVGPLMACSRTIATEAVDWIGRLRQAPVVVEDGADDIPAEGPDFDLIARLRHAAEGRTIVAVLARLIPLKRIEDVLTACRILLDEDHRIFVLLIAYGKEKREERMRTAFEEGFGPGEGLFLYRLKAPQHLLPLVGVGVSASILEGLGLNILEFQSAGLPVVCTDIPAHREMVVDGQTGLLFPPKDIAALIRALKRVLGDPELAARLGRAGQASARRRTWRQAALRTLEVYRALLEGGPPRRDA